MHTRSCVTNKKIIVLSVEKYDFPKCSTLHIILTIVQGRCVAFRRTFPIRLSAEALVGHAASLTFAAVI